jgi:hypothetical protein
MSYDVQGGRRAAVLLQTAIANDIAQPSFVAFSMWKQALQAFSHELNPTTAASTWRDASHSRQLWPLASACETHDEYGCSENPSYPDERPKYWIPTLTRAAWVIVTRQQETFWTVGSLPRRRMSVAEPLYRLFSWKLFAVWRVATID